MSKEFKNYEGGARPSGKRSAATENEIKEIESLVKNRRAENQDKCPHSGIIFMDKFPKLVKKDGKSYWQCPECKKLVYVNKNSTELLDQMLSSASACSDLLKITYPVEQGGDRTKFEVAVNLAIAARQCYRILSNHLNKSDEKDKNNKHKNKERSYTRQV